MDERKLRCADVVRPGIGSGNYVAELPVPSHHLQLTAHTMTWKEDRLWSRCGFELVHFHELVRMSVAVGMVDEGWNDRHVKVWEYDVGRAIGNISDAVLYFPKTA